VPQQKDKLKELSPTDINPNDIAPFLLSNLVVKAKKFTERHIPTIISVDGTVYNE
jgi:hypothetical protein